jgi:hypothetical protein
MIRRHGGHSQRSSRSQIQPACKHPSRSATVTRARSAWAKEPGRRGLRARIVLACAEPGPSGQQVADMLGTTKVTAGMWREQPARLGAGPDWWQRGKLERRPQLWPCRAGPPGTSLGPPKPPA